MLLLDPMEETLNEFKSLVQVVAQLRGPSGCPWDQEQTQQSLAQYVIEEAFELVEALEGQEQEKICEELGDCLFQVILQAQVASEQKSFSLQEVIINLRNKLVARHPHVFSNVKVKNSAEVWQQWHKMKNAEGRKQNKPLFSYPRNLPALQAALKIGKKTEGFGFDWNHADEVLVKVKEELRETEEALAGKSAKEIEHEIGDVLFSVAQLARHQGLDPEAALREANRRFEKRFLKVLELANKDQAEFQSLTPSEMNELWTQAKKLTGSQEN